MRITRYGITLEKLTPENAEMVRRWRNDEKIAKHMFHQGVITEQMQQTWLQSIDNDSNFFFVIYYQNQAIGLINISSVDWENKTAYSGLFIYEDKFLGTDVPVISSLCMLDVFLLLFDIQSVYAKVRGNNNIAHKYNSALGFGRTKKIELGLGYEYILQKEIYLLETKKLRNAAIRLKGNETVIQFDESNATDVLMKKRLEKVSSEKLHSLAVVLT
jgi:RimJ/RimL family protein N-acetyltransferase